MKRELSRLSENIPWYNGAPDALYQVAYRGQPFFNSEFGGTWWQPNVDPNDPSWGYGRRPKNIEEFYTRFTSLCAVLLDDPNQFGYCYTQLTDVEQEQNGIYFYDRKEKFDMTRIRAAQQRPAAIEKQRG